MKSLIDSLTWYTIIAIVGVANFVKKHYWQIAAFIVAAGLTVAVLTMSGCVIPFIGDTADKADNNGNGIPDVEDKGWDVAEFAASLAGYAIPGVGGLAAGGVAYMRKKREAEAMAAAAEVAASHVDDAIELLPLDQQRDFKTMMLKKQERMGVRNTIQKVRGKT